jgi:hypothetical protein
MRHFSGFREGKTCWLANPPSPSQYTHIQVLSIPQGFLCLSPVHLGFLLALLVDPEDAGDVPTKRRSIFTHLHDRNIPGHSFLSLVNLQLLQKKYIRK